MVSRNSTDGLLLGAWRTPPDFNNKPYLDPVSGLHRSFRFPNPGPGSEQLSRSYDNPFFVANEAESTTDVSRVYGGVSADWNANGWLTFSENLGYDYANDERLQGYPWSNSNTTVAGVNGVGGLNAGYIRNSQVDQTFTATAKYRMSPKWAGTVMIGQNLNSQTYRTRQVVGTTLITPKPFNLGNTAAQRPPYDFESTVRLESYFAQVSADLWDQLFLTAALRNDGASTFGAENRRNWYPKASAAWTFHRGEVGENKFLTYGKLRAAYGQSGTQPAPYLLASTLVTWAAADGGWGPSIGSSQGGAGGLVTNYNLPTQELGPERVKEFETGFDVGLLRDAADLSLTYYRSFSTDVILNVPVAGSSGYTEKPANAAELRNFGWEIALNARPVNKREWGFDFGLQWATNKSLVTDLAGVQFAPLPFSGGTNGLSVQSVAAVNQRLGVFWARTSFAAAVGSRSMVSTSTTLLAIAWAPRAIRCTSTHRDIRSSTSRRTTSSVIPIPDWTGSFRMGFRWKKVSVTGLLDVRYGGQAHNGTRGALNHFGTSKETQVLRDGGTYTFGSDYFKKEHVAGPGAGMAVPLNEGWFTGAGGIFNGATSQFLEDASYAKLREISVGYLFDDAWVLGGLGFNSMEVRVAGRNLHTWTGYSGIDPETSVLGSASGAARGWITSTTRRPGRGSSH